MRSHRQRYSRVGRFFRGILVVSIGVGGTVTMMPSASAVVGPVERISIASGGADSHGNSGGIPAEMSADARFIAFSSIADNLVPDDTNGQEDVFVRDRQAQTTELVSVSADGASAAGFSAYNEISADGRYVAFVSNAADMVPGGSGYGLYLRDRVNNTTERLVDGVVIEVDMTPDARFVAYTEFVDSGNGFEASNTFVLDRQDGTTELVSVDATGQPASNDARQPAISDDGRFVVFATQAPNIVPPGGAGGVHVFVRDRETQTTEQVDLTPSGDLSAQYSNAGAPVMSGDGRFIAFASDAGDLTIDDDNSVADVFLRDMTSRSTRRVSVGQCPLNDGGGGYLDITADGRYVAFSSAAELVPRSQGDRGPNAFVWDAETGVTNVVSSTPDGGVANGSTFGATLSPDARFVVFASDASNFVAGDANDGMDVYFREIAWEQTHAPCAPRNVAVQPRSDGSAHITWSPPVNDGGAIVSRYTLEFYDLDWDRPGPTVEVDGSTLVADVADVATPDDDHFYQVSVTAWNAVGKGATSTVPVLTVPGPPDDVSADNLGSSVLVSWDSPRDWGGTAITGYTATSSPDGITKDVGVSYRASFDDLRPGVPYTFTVTATNVIGASAPSRPTNPVTLEGPPAAPTNVVGAAGDGEAFVTWSEPPDGGSPITSYTLTTLNGGGTPVSSQVTTDNAATVPELTNGTTYRFHVEATNAVGTSPPSNPSSPVTPQAGASDPSAVTERVDPGGSVSTDPGDGPTPGDPVTTDITVPSGGEVTIVETTLGGSPAPTGWDFLNQQVHIDAPDATASAPLAITFTVEGSQLGVDPGNADPAIPASLDVFRTENGTRALVAPCSDPQSTIAAPDPCIPSSSRGYVGSDVAFTVLTSSASDWNVAVAPVRVAVTDVGYTPKAAVASVGRGVLWTFSGSRAHTVTDSAKLGASGKSLFDSGSKTAGTFSFRFFAAGTYPYRSVTRGDPSSMTGTIGVPVRVAPSTGSTTTTFTVALAGSSLPSGYVEDVQVRFRPMGSSTWRSWATWKNNVTAPSAAFKPSMGRGTYEFQARLRNKVSGSASAYSPSGTITVT